MYHGGRCIMLWSNEQRMMVLSPSLHYCHPTFSPTARLIFIFLSRFISFRFISISIFIFICRFIFMLRLIQCVGCHKTESYFFTQRPWYIATTFTNNQCVMLQRLWKIFWEVLPALAVIEKVVLIKSSPSSDLNM